MANVDQRAERSHDDRLADVIESYLTATESGEAPSRIGLLEQHPDLADDLAACFETLDFIGHSLGQAPATAVLECGQQFGEYQILREIGRGGMGVVYEAFHLGLERRVALKVLSGRSFEDERQRERFLLEAKTAAGLHHTNIVPIFEVGELDGVCYYAMQFIQGQSLGAVVRSLRNRVRKAGPADTTIFPPGTIVRDQRPAAADEKVQEASEPSASSAGGRSVPSAPQESAMEPLSTTPSRLTALSSPRLGLAEGPVSDRYFREAARVIAQAADALSHAHAHDVVHRDVKPSNLILDGEGRIWVADFGLAFRSDDPAQSGSDAVGTPAYMSPEQVRTGTAPVDRRTDIYSLGATLYELLTLRPIFEGATSLSVLTQIATVEPVPPQRENPRVPRDLDCIVRKATAKRAEDRYSDAAEFAEDLRRYLEFAPIRARNVGPVERLTLWCRREPRLAAVTVAAVVILLAVSGWFQLRVLHQRNLALTAKGLAETAKGVAEAERDRVAAAESKATEHLWEALYQQARATRLSFQTGRRLTALELIRQAREIRNEPELRDEAIAALALRDSRLYKQLPAGISIDMLAFCPDGQRLACSSRDGSVRLCNLDGSEPIVLAQATNEVQTMAFSICGRLLATAFRDGPLEIWDVQKHVLIDRLEVDFFTATFVTFLSEPTRLVAISPDGTCMQWGIADRAVKPLPSHKLDRWHLAAPGPDNNSVTLILQSGEVTTWNVDSGERATISGPTLKVRRAGMTWDPAGITWDSAGRILAIGRTNSVDLVGATESRTQRSLGGYRGPVNAIGFNSNGTVLAAGSSFDPHLKLWDTATGELIAALSEPQSRTRAVSFSPDGRFVAAGGGDKSIWVWELAAPKSFRRLAAHDEKVTRVAFTPDGKQIVSGDADGAILVWPIDSSDGPRQVVPASDSSDPTMQPNACYGLSVSQDSRLLAVRARIGSIHVLNLESGEEVASYKGRSFWGGRSIFLPDSHDLIRSHEGVIERWPVSPEAPPSTIVNTRGTIVAMAMSLDGQFIAASSQPMGRGGPGRNRIEVFDVSTGQPVCRPLDLTLSAVALALSPDGKLLAVGHRTGVMHLYSLPTGRLVKSWNESNDDILAVAFSPDGSLFGAAGRDGQVRLHDSASGDVVARLPGHAGGVESIAFSNDGTRLATCGDDKLIHLWQLDSLRGELASMDLAW
jgi:WD40 repeat protein/serine/threonine protein kinase